MSHAVIQKKKISKTLAVGFIAFFAAFGAFFILLSKAATVGPNLGFYMTTTNASPAVGAQFDVKLYANTGSTPVQSVAAAVKYDTNQVRLDLAAVAPAADPINGIDGFDATLACTSATSCSSPGKASFALTMTATPPAVTTKAGDGIYVGTLRFTALKAGATGIEYDASKPVGQNNTAAPLTGFVNNTSSAIQNQLDGREIQNVAVTVPSSGGNSTPPPPITGNTTQTNQPNTKPGTTTNTTKKATGNTSTGSSAGTQQTGSSTPSDSTQSTDNQQPTAVPGTTNGSGGSSDSDGSSGDGPKNVSKPMIIVASAGLAALIVGTLMAAFSEPVRTAFMGVGHVLHPQHIQPAGHVVVGGPSLPATPPAPHVDPTPTNPVNPIKPISHLDPPKTSNTIPSHAGAPGKVIEPSQPPTEE